MPDNFLTNTISLFRYYKSLGDKTFAQLTDEQLFWQPNPASNSIAIIVQHLWGNMRSRWTDFLTSDGEKEWRERDAEFEARITSRQELLGKWEAGWACLFDALNALTPNDLDTIIYIRNQGHTVADAISRQLAHYASHVGQLLYIGKLLQGDAWTSLSIPKGESQAYNTDTFAKPKHTEHFTNEFLKK